jgi:hypothetical protein
MRHREKDLEQRAQLEAWETEGGSFGCLPPPPVQRPLIENIRVIHKHPNPHLYKGAGSSGHKIYPQVVFELQAGESQLGCSKSLVSFTLLRRIKATKH